MKRLLSSCLAKTVAIALFVLFALGFAAGCFGLAYNFAEGSYDGAAPAFEDSFWCSALISRQLQRLSSALQPDVLSLSRAWTDASPAPMPTAEAAGTGGEGAAAGEASDPTPMPASTAAPAGAGISAAPATEAADGDAISEDIAAALASALLDQLSSLELPQNLALRVSDLDGTLLYDSADSLSGYTTRDSWVMYRCYGSNGEIATFLNGLPGPGFSEAGWGFLLRISLRQACVEGDAFFTAAVWHYRLLAARNWLFPVVGALLLLCLGLLVFLLCAAGRRKDEPSPRCAWIDRIPTDLFYAAVLLLAFSLVCLILRGAELLSGSWQVAPLLALAALGGTALALLALLLLMSTATRVKTRTFFRNSVVFHVLRFFYRILRRVCRALAELLQNLPALWKLYLLLLGYAGFSLVFLLSRSGFGLLLWCGLTLTGLVFLSKFVLALQRLYAGAKRMRDGDLSVKIPLSGLYGACRAHAQCLNDLAEGMGRAVEARMKSERMKTDLITNVSHDIKTPLTSIVNYVDLLKKEALDNETAAGYVQVLDRQAQRLKKLTEDLVEASKAQSGALNVVLAPTDLAELLRQCAAEYEERFAAAELTPILTLPEAGLSALADGRLLFRVLDNLLNNAVKYALPGTRVYIDVAALDGQARIALRNVSREALNMDPAELTARFVRGDASRATEGSGLGLSIADDLMKLQGGRLILSIDGDLFRADLLLPLVVAERDQ